MSTCSRPSPSHWPVFGEPSSMKPASPNPSSQKLTSNEPLHLCAASVAQNDVWLTTIAEPAIAAVQGASSSGALAAIQAVIRSSRSGK